MSEQFAKPGEVGLIYTDDKGKHHLLALRTEQHQVLQAFVHSLTKDEPAIQVENFEVFIREKSKTPLKLIYFGTNISSAGHYFWNVSADGNTIIARHFSEEILPFDIERIVPTDRGEKTLYTVFTDTSGFPITVLAFEGSPYDKRGGCKSVFLSAGEHSEDDMIEAIKKSPVCTLILKEVARTSGYSKAAETDINRIEKIIGKI